MEPKTINTPKRAAVLAVCFAAPAVLMTAVFAACGICPFGANSLGVIDMSHQYMAFLAYCRELLNGGGDLLYLPELCLGCSLPAALAYYIASPLNLIFCLFKTEQMLCAVSLVYILRVGLCGLSMGVFLCRRQGVSFRAVFGALAYGFAGYMIAYSFNFLWLDCVILLPILALGIAKLAAGKKPWLYIAVLAVCIMMSYYIGYMLCIFSVLWFAYELLCAGKQPALGRRLGVFALASLAAGALSAVILLPQLLTVGGGKAEFSLSVLTLAARFDLPALGSKLFTGAFRYEEIMPDGLPNIYCGLGVLTLACLYFFNRRIPARRRLAAGGLLAVLTLSFWVTGLDLIWHCLNEPDWFNARYSFIFGFLLAALAGEDLYAPRDAHRAWHYAAPVLLLGLITAGAFFGRSYDYVTLQRALLCLAGTVVLSALLLARRGKRAAALLTAFICLTGAELAVNAGLDFSVLTSPAHATRADGYAAYAASKEEALSLVPKTADFTRTESTAMFDYDRCEALLYGYNGVSGYSSTIPRQNLDFLKNLGYTWFDDQWALYGTGVTSAADSLLGVRYILARPGELPYAAAAQTDEWVVCENENALPLAFLTAQTVTAPVTGEGCFDYLQAVFQAAAGSDLGALFTAAQVEAVTTQNLDVTAADGADVYTAQTAGSAGTVSWELVTGSAGRLFAQWDTADTPGALVYVNGAPLSYHLTTQSNGSLCLGSFEAGERVTVKLQFAVGLTINAARFATENADTLSAYSQLLRDGGCPMTEVKSSRFSGVFAAGDGDAYLLVTLPNDGGWTVTVDGRPVEPQTAFDCLLAIPVPAGRHSVALRYTPAGLLPGAAVSGTALLVCVLAGLLLRKKSKRPAV